MASVRDGMPESLASVLEEFESLDLSERTELLLEYADRFQEVPSEIAKRPFPEEHRVRHCESVAFVWADAIPDHRIRLYFAVESQQGVSAKALAAILDETLSGRNAQELTTSPTDIVFSIFGRDVSMGKGQGLMGIVSMVTSLARNMPLSV